MSEKLTNKEIVKSQIEHLQTLNQNNGLTNEMIEIRVNEVYELNLVKRNEVIKYELIGGYAISDLNNEIALKINQGYTPFGNVIIDNANFYSQAMGKYKI